MKILILAAVLLTAYGSTVRHRKAMENPNLFEGDISGMDRLDRNAVPYDSLRWPKGEIPYFIDKSVSHIKDLIMKGINHIEERSCIRFIPKTSEKDYIHIFSGEGCYSDWGRSGGVQPVSLGHDCDHFIIVIHELMHAVGFEHEHSRSDRDDYIEIIWRNIDPLYHDQFFKLHADENRLLTVFDYDSVMLYGPTAFGKDDESVTMKSKTSTPVTDSMLKPGLSKLDVQRIQLLYQCL